MLTLNQRTDRMARPTGLNEEVAGIVTAVLGDMSLEQAAQRTGYALSRTPIGDLKRGKIGREETLRTFAESFWDRICAQYGELVKERFGECTQKTTSDWLAQKAGFGVRFSNPVPPPSGPMQDPNLEEFDIAGFQGIGNLEESDRTLINEAVRAMLRAAHERQARE